MYMAEGRIVCSTTRLLQLAVNSCREGVCRRWEKQGQMNRAEKGNWQRESEGRPPVAAS